MDLQGTQKKDKQTMNVSNSQFPVLPNSGDFPNEDVFTAMQKQQVAFAQNFFDQKTIPELPSWAVPLPNAEKTKKQTSMHLANIQTSLQEAQADELETRKGEFEKKALEMEQKTKGLQLPKICFPSEFQEKKKEILERKQAVEAEFQKTKKLIQDAEEFFKK